MTRRLLVLSDLHISPPGPLATFHAGPALAALLQDNARPDTTLVLAGDIVDFLQVDGRPPVLDMPGAPALMRRTLAAIAAEPWGRAILDGLAALLRTGGQCVLLPGNHDPELHHPDTRAIFLDALGLPDHPGFTLHTEDAPWTTVVGGSLPVRVGHGHRLDSWNDIRPESVFRAIETGNDKVALPPGSRLVLDILNPIKRAVHRTSGAPRFGFVDLLKPEKQTALLLVPYLDWDAAAGHLGTAGGLAARTFLRGFERALRRGPVLGTGEAPESPPTIEEILAEAVADELSEADRLAPDATIRAMRALIDGSAALTPAPGTLAAHGGAWRRWLRDHLRRVAADGSFFDSRKASADDREIIAEQLPEGSGPCVAIYGHTHAARHLDFGDGRVYLNTGTWMDLMKLPDLANDAEVEAWIDRLEAGDVERVTNRRTWAEVTAEGAFLRGLPSA